MARPAQPGPFFCYNRTMRVNEDWIIARAAKLHPGEAVVGIGDDTAIVKPPTDPQLLATDMLVEGTHFTRQTLSAQDLGWKALAVNLSDIAAMGGWPDYCLLSLGLPPDLDDGWVDAFFSGLEACSERYGCPLIGGDTVRSPLIVISVAITGHAARPIRREGAKPGDLIVVLGDLGASAAGLWLLQHPAVARDHFMALIQAHQRPEPLLQTGRQWANTVHAGCDASDGLARSCRLLAEAGTLAAVIVEERLPVAGAVRAVAERAAVDPLSWVVAGGEDYALVAAIAPQDEAALTAWGAQVVGYFETGTVEVWLESHAGRRPVPSEWGFQHF